MTSTGPFQTGSIRRNLRPPRRPVYSISSDEDEGDDLNDDVDQFTGASNSSEVLRNSEPASRHLYPVAESSDHVESDGSGMPSFGVGSMPDSIYIHKKRVSVCDDYVDRVARTPSKCSLKKRSVSSPNLSARKGKECVRGLPFEQRPGSFRHFLGAQLASVTKPPIEKLPLQPTGASRQLVNTVECTPAMRQPLLRPASGRLYEKENVPLMYRRHETGERKLQDSKPRPAAPVSVSHAPKWGPSPLPSLCFDHGRTPSYGRPTVSTTAAGPTSTAGGAPDCLEINGKLYTGLKYLARGGSCSVYQAMDPEGTMVAVKIVDLRGLEEEEVAMFTNEVDVLARLQHLEHVIRLLEHEHKVGSSHLYMVLEKGETDFAAYLKERQGRLQPRELRRFWLEMLQAVHSIHAEGIIHSDLKPGNFLLVNGRLKLIDFGIASTLRPEATSVTRLGKAGTYNFISPEAISEIYRVEKNEAAIKIGVKSDVWSLGCILYLMAFGKTPFGHIVKAAAKECAIRDPTHEISIPPEGRSCDRDLEDVLKRCLVRKPSERASTVELLNHAFVTTDRSPPVASFDSIVADYQSLSPASKRRVLAFFAQERALNL